MHALAFEPVEVGGEGRDERLAFARAHFGDAALVKHHAADQLDVEMALPQHALGGLAYGGEGRHQKIIELGAGGELLAKGDGALRQLLVAQRGDFRLERVDRGDLRTVGFQPSVV